jgi:dTMP kinase
MKRKLPKGLLIAFEGIDGTGKSTQICLLAEKLRKMGLRVEKTREPTNGYYGAKIRELYADRGGTSLEDELQLFIADRREHVETVINPAIEAGGIVLTDRYYYSTAAYQGAAGLDPQRILQLNEEFAPRPDLVLLIDLPVSESIHRIEVLRNETLNAFEQENNLVKVKQIFDALRGDHIKTVDGTKSIEDVHASIMMYVDALMPEVGRA